VDDEWYDDALPRRRRWVTWVAWIAVAALVVPLAVAAVDLLV
jgi:hypothetical protein